MDTPAWSIKQIAETEYGDLYTEIRLGPLSPQDSQALLGELLPNLDPQPGLYGQILEKAEGNPFFIEEVVRGLVHREVLVTGPGGLQWNENHHPVEIDIPEPLHSLLVARLDVLEEDARRTLQLASVIGRSFYYEVLR